MRIAIYADIYLCSQPIHVVFFNSLSLLDQYNKQIMQTVLNLQLASLSMQLYVYDIYLASRSISHNAVRLYIATVYTVTLAYTNRLLCCYCTNLQQGFLESSVFILYICSCYAATKYLQLTETTFSIPAHIEHTACTLIEGKQTAAYLLAVIKLNLSFIMCNYTYIHM